MDVGDAVRIGRRLGFIEECRALEIPYGQGFYLGVPAEKAASEPAREFTGRIRTAR